MRDYKDLMALAKKFGFTVTSTTGGTHNRNSKHFLGLAIDVRTRDKKDSEIRLFMEACKAIGVRVLDERVKPKGQAVWSGAHLHLDIGSQTQPKVKDFQKNHNLKIDGIAGQKTLRVLRCIYSQ